MSIFLFSNCEKNYLGFQWFWDNLQDLRGGDIKGATMIEVVYGYSQPLLQSMDNYRAAK